jgi:hypothetical protein
MIDELSEARLHAEIECRQAYRQRGLCDYCGQPPSSQSCRFQMRHQAPAVTARFAKLLSSFYGEKLDPTTATRFQHELTAFQKQEYANGNIPNVEEWTIEADRDRLTISRPKSIWAKNLMEDTLFALEHQPHGNGPRDI